MNNPSLFIRQFRVYSPLKPKLVLRIWARDDRQAVLDAKDRNPRFSRLEAVKAFPA